MIECSLYSPLPNDCVWVLFVNLESKMVATIEHFLSKAPKCGRIKPVTRHVLQVF